MMLVHARYSPRATGTDRRAFACAVHRRLAAAFAFLVLSLLAAPVRAEPNYPAFSAPVVDAAHVLSDADRAAITRKLLDLQKKTGVQFVVATVPSLDGLEIEPYANGLFRAWKIGEKGVNNGLLLILAPKERKLRFEVGYGLEGMFTDLQSKLILRNAMVPKLRANDSAGALTAGVDDAILVLTKDKAALPAHLQPNQTGDMVLGFFIFALIIVIFFIILVSILRRRGGTRWGPAATGGFIGAGSSDFSSDTSGGDSFSGGGGGDSGGGGSSDSY